MERIPWNQYFMAQSVLLSLRSTCKRLEVGATIVRDKRIIAGGYNGSVSGDVHCIDEGCYVVNGHCVRHHPRGNECDPPVRQIRRPDRGCGNICDTFPLSAMHENDFAGRHQENLLFGRLSQRLLCHPPFGCNGYSV